MRWEMFCGIISVTAWFSRNILRLLGISCKYKNMDNKPRDIKDLAYALIFAALLKHRQFFILGIFCNFYTFYVYKTILLCNRNWAMWAAWSWHCTTTCKSENCRFYTLWWMVWGNFIVRKMVNVQVESSLLCFHHVLKVCGEWKCT